MKLRLPLAFAAAALYLAAAPLPTALRVAPEKRDLRGSGAAQQFLAIASYADGSERDVTEQVSWQLANAAVAEVSPQGLVQVRQDGSSILTARLGKLAASASIRVDHVNDQREFSFGRDIGGILTRAGCNGSSCHGGVKGRGGFKLSNGGLLPRDDYEWIVKGGAYQVLTAEVKGERVPRINLNEPEKSLLLLKPTGGLPHGGGVRFRAGSTEYNQIADWIRQGAPFGPAASATAKLERLEIYPRTVTLEKGGTHRLLVMAHMSDGSVEDFSRAAWFESNDKDVVSASQAGVVAAKRVGETAVIVRAAGTVGSAIVGVIGESTAAYPSTPRNNFIDDFVFDKLRRFRIFPSGPADDSEFLRRVCLDLTGTLPPPERAREFVVSRDPHKRAKLIDTLIASPEFVDYWTYRFDDVFRVAVFANGIVPKWSQMYAEWVRSSIAANKPYDQMARERLAAQGYDGPTRHYLPYNVIGPPGETMAEEVRVFFGRRLDCAQCHNHPYESWSQDQFWGMAAFFGRVFKMGDTGTEYVIFDHPYDQPMGNGDVDGSLAMLHPRTKAELKPAFLDGMVVQTTGQENPRKALAAWMTQHPYFAEAAANRMWAYFFGRGLVNPVDDFRSTNPATHPELLQALAAEFRKSGHNLRALMRLIVSSRTYQLSAETSESNIEDRTNYSHAFARPLDAEVLLDAICAVTGVPETFTTGVSEMTRGIGQAPYGTRAISLREPDLFYSRFLDLYGRPNRLTLPERNPSPSLGQALNMLAGTVYNNKLDVADSRLQRLLQSGKTNREIIEEFYWAAYSRPPETETLTALERMIEARPARPEALKDFVWALLSSREFAENH